MTRQARRRALIYFAAMTLIAIALFVRTATATHAKTIDDNTIGTGGTLTFQCDPAGPNPAGATTSCWTYWA